MALTPEDRAKLTTFDEARAGLQRGGYAGVGLAMLPDWKLTALDFDDCVADGVVHPEVLRLVTGTYAELSPSGTGVRAFMRGPLAGADKSADGLAKHGFKFEAYPTKQFVTVTGNVVGLDIADELAGASIVDLTNAVRDHATLRFAKPESRDASASAGKPHALTAGDVRDMLAHIADNVDRDSWKDVCFAAERTALTSKDGALTHDAVLGLVDDWSRRGDPNYTGRQSVERKMLEARRREDGYGVGSLWAWAQDGGWTPSAEQVARLHPDSGAKPDDFEDHTAGKPAPDEPDPFKFLSMWQLADRPLPTWFIEGVLPQAQLGMIVGAPGSGKSFFAFDLALHLSRGIPWRDKEVKQTRVAWIAAEASGSVGLRARAYEQHYDVKRDFDIPVLAHAPDLGKPEDVKRIVAAMVSHGTRVLFVDTFSAAAGGREENSSEIDKVLSGCRHIARKTGALVLLIHHVGKDSSRGARGWSGIHAAMDLELTVERVGDTNRVARVTKLRDGQDSAQFGFKLSSVWVDTGGDDGKVVTSCVVEPVEVTPISRGPKLGANEKVVRDALIALTLSGPDVPIGDLIDEAVARMSHDPKAPRDRRREVALRAITSARDKGMLQVSADLVRLPAG